jgi:hypothetical protein
MEPFSAGDIIPGERVGSFSLGMSWSTLQRQLPHEYVREQRHGCFVVQLPSVWFYIDDQAQILTGITVLNAFHGKLFGSIGVGTTLGAAESVVGHCFPNDDLGWETLQCPGVSFFLGAATDQHPSDTWELRPIAYISVHSTKR